jgi:pro-kumamolisin-like protein/Big-like domain-containing protein
MGSLPRLILFAILCVCGTGRCAAQDVAATQFPTGPAAQASTATAANIPARVVNAIDEHQLVTLKGNVHPLARAEFDRGLVADGQPMRRMLLLLQRSPDQEATLQQLLGDQQSKSSARFHSWLTPQEFGAQFGPADADVQAVTGWLASHGFSGIKVGAGRTVVEFSGNVAQVRAAFHTEMHQYSVKGKMHFANASDPQIPAALRPLVAGVVALNNFPVQSHARMLGAFRKSRLTGETKPLFTTACGSQSGICYAVGPADFATIYNTAPLLNGSPKIDGSGQGIAVVGSSNINVQDVVDFRTMFGLSQNFSASNVILNGPDPGLIPDTEAEADLDVEWSGAVAPGARIDFVTSEDTETTSGVHLSALYIVDQNLDAVMSESFGSCEQNLGAVVNQFYSSLWEQASAQGITVILSSGDAGPAGCDDFNSEATATQGLGVSGYASTPYNVAVGGTDFDDGARASQFWNTTPTPTSPTPIPSSAKSYIPEIPWNDSCGALGLTGCNGSDGLNIIAGSGGVSTVYSKPSWQVGKGVPNDNHRDVPDVSLFSGNGLNGSFYIFCNSDSGVGHCDLTALDSTFQGVGGTSASAPAFAGIMALVNQKQATVQNPAPRQGNANYFLYALAQQQNTANLACNSSSAPVAGCTFNDVTKGNNAVPCTGGSANCSSHVASTNGVLVNASAPTVPAYTTTAGYDLATGLGSVNAQNLVNKWSSVNTAATTTSLTLNGGTAVNVTHGATVPFQVGVSPTSASGDVSLIAVRSSGEQTGIGPFTLASGAVSGSTNALPGGASYSVHAHYEGNGTDAPSDSAPVNVTVAREPSKVLISLPTFDPTTGQETGNTATSVVYGAVYLLRADVTNAAGSLSNLCAKQNCPTGTVTIADSVGGHAQGAPNSGTFTLNSEGYTEDQAANFPGGTNVITATYSGDGSFAPPAQPTTFNLTVTPAPLKTFSLVNQPTAPVNQAIQLSATLDTGVLNGAAPSGTFTFYDGGVPLPGQPVTSPVAGSLQTTAIDSAGLSYTFTTPGVHQITATYQGDPDYAAGSAAAMSVDAQWQTLESGTASAQTLNYGQQLTLTAVVTSTAKTPPMTGTINFGNGIGAPTGTPGTDANGNQTLTASVTFTPTIVGNMPYFAFYSGDANYEPVAYEFSQVTVIAPDFTISPNPSSLAVTAGQQASTAINIAPLTGGSSTVALSCMSPITGVSCSVTPASENLANNTAVSATLNVVAVSGTSAPTKGVVTSAGKRRRSIVPMTVDWWSFGGFSGCAAVLVLLLFSRRRELKFAAGVSFATVALLALGCGGGGSSSGGGGGGGGTQGATSVSVTLSSNGKVPAGQPIMATATVTTNGSAPLTGFVQFFDLAQGGQTSVSGSVTVSNGQAQASLTPFSLGIHEIVAKYSADVKNQGSESAIVPLVSTGMDNVEVQGSTAGVVHTVPVSVTIQ